MNLQRDGVMVLGVGGVGEVVAKGLARLPHLKSIVLADRSAERVEAVKQRIGDPRIRTCVIDARDTEALARELKQDTGIVIHAGIPRFNLQVMEAALSAGCHYIDMAADGPVELPGLVTIQKQMTYDEVFRSKGLMALLGIGVDPGVTNILARYAKDHMGSIDEIVVYDGDNSVVKDYPFAIAFSPDTSIEECLQPPLAYRDGAFHRETPLVSGIEEFTFPDPVGKLTVRSVSHEEVGTLPIYLGVEGLRRCEFKYALSDEYVNILSVLHTLGLDREDPVMVNGHPVVPRNVVTALLPQPADLTNALEGTSCVGTWVKGTLPDGTPTEMYLYTMGSHAYSRHDMGANVTVWQAGIPSVIAVDLMFRGMLDVVGTVVPEQLDPTPWVRELPRWGMALYARATHTTEIHLSNALA
ncbi:MAG: saccharopine dehydrogenase NADP-binding domain-containing protein [Firmicutes bacterium]|nr:saccharopine dehydrogenase NADP-binding domain-containing protein [Bacillota bacterium]